MELRRLGDPRVRRKPKVVDNPLLLLHGHLQPHALAIRLHLGHNLGLQLG
jgi:hypothetical protein